MILASMVATIPIVILFYTAYSHFIRMFIQKIEEVDQSNASVLINFFMSIEGDLKLVVFGGTLILLTFNALFFLVLSHAIAGPIEKLKAHLQKKAQNEPTGPFSIRSSDFFSELPEYVNAVFKDEVPKPSKD